MGAVNSAEVLALIKASQKINVGDPLIKAFTGPSNAVQGINNYDLSPGAKILYPVTTILRNMIPRVVGGVGIQANWRSITALNPSNMAFGVSDGQRGGNMDQTVANVLAAFAHFSLENYVTLDANLAAQGFDDVRSLATTMLLQAVMEQEEKLILGGNFNNTLGTCATPTGVVSASGGTLATSATYSIICVEVTYDGMLQSTFPTSTGSGASLVYTGGLVKLPYVRSNADGTTDTINGFAGQKSAASSAQNVTGPNGSITATVVPSGKALGYAWFVGATAGTEKLFTITGQPSVLITALNATGQAASAGFASDLSANALNYNGLLTQIMTSGSGSYVTDLNNAFMTATTGGSGGIAQIDNAIVSMYQNFRLVPTDIFMNGVDQINARNKILAANTNMAPFFLAGTAGGNDNQVMGAAQFKAYQNPIGFGNQTLRVHAHPFLPQGTILLYSDKVPYALSNVAQLLRIYLQRDYFQTEWPVITRKYTYAVSFDGVLQNFFPPAFGVIKGVGNG
jgi:hypothetical protein